jgi:hypothetical protein
MKMVASKIILALAVSILVAANAKAMPDLSVGEFAPRDPQVNLYTFVDNNPINEVDPLGLFGTPAENEALVLAVGEEDAADTIGPAAARAAAQSIEKRAAQEAAKAAEQKLLKECRKLGDNELKRLLKTDDVHGPKDIMKKQFGDQLKGDKNFNVLLDKTGKVVLQGNKSGTLVPTGLPPSAFAP